MIVNNTNNIINYYNCDNYNYYKYIMNNIIPNLICTIPKIKFNFNHANLSMVICNTHKYYI